MKIKRILLVCLLVVVMPVAGCTDTGGGPTVPSNDAPILSNARVDSLEKNPGAIVIFSIDFVDVDGNLNGGTAVITDNQRFRYDNNSGVNNAVGTAGILTISIELSPLVAPGELVFYIYVQDQAGNPSNQVTATITIL